ncbi:hypothetical protein MRX96_029184 [Rhipicephalus microplus]
MGGVSPEGLLFSALGGAFIGLVYYLAMALFVGPSSLQAASAQWLVILVGTLAGFLGSLLDSFLGANPAVLRCACQDRPDSRTSWTQHQTHLWCQHP